MAKLMTLVKSARGLSAADFAHHWQFRFLPAVLALEAPARSLYKAVHHHVLPSHIREEEGLPANEWAGVASYYFANPSDVVSTLADPAYSALLDAQRDVIAVATHLIVDELWVYDRDPSHLPVKMFAFFKRLPHLSRADAQAYYRTTHAAVGERVNRDRTVRYVQNHVVAGYRNPDAAWDYDAGPEIWFKSMAIALDLFGDREAMETLGRDEQNFVRRDELLHFMTDEQLVHERAPPAT